MPSIHLILCHPLLLLPPIPPSIRVFSSESTLHMRWPKSLSRVQLFAIHGLQPTRLLCPWDFLGKNTGVDCCSLLQGIFPTQRSNPDLLHCRQILYFLSHQRSYIDHSIFQKDKVGHHQMGNVLASLFLAPSLCPDHGKRIKT